MTKDVYAASEAADEKTMTKDEFAAAVTANEKKLYIAALSVVRNTEDARDAVASAVAHAWEKLDSLRDVNKFDGWLLQITYNEAKKQKRHGSEFVSLSDIEDSFAYGPDTGSIEFFDLLSSARLDNKSRQIIILRFFYGYDLAKTAEMLGLPLSTVKTKYYRALDKFKKLPGIM